MIISNAKKYNRPKYSLEFKQDATKLVLEKATASSKRPINYEKFKTQEAVKLSVID